MIVAEQKSVEEIKAMISSYEKVLVLGCGTCVTISFAGGEKEVGVLASALRMSSAVEEKDAEFDEGIVKRQCECSADGTCCTPVP